MVRLGTVLLITAATVTGCLNYIQHSPALAVDVAEKFSQEAFVDRNFTAAYERLPQEKGTFTEAALADFVKSMHPGNNFPSFVKATGWEAVPGQRMIRIYLKGAILGKPTFYCLELNGDSKGYAITAMYRRDDPFQPSANFRSIE